MPKNRRFESQYGPVAITAALVLLVVASIAAPRLRGRSPQERRGESVYGPSPGPSEAHATPQVFRYFSEQPGTLDPALASDAYSSIVIAQIFSPLVGLTSDLEPVPQVAESWTISRDGLVYLFQLHKGVRFHNGREVQASDFVYSLTRLFKEPFRSRGLAAGYLDAIVGVPEFVSGRSSSIRGIRALDRYRLEVRLSRPYGALLSALALDQASVVPRECVEARGIRPFAQYPVGCGPFRVAYGRNNNEFLVLASNHQYFLGRPAIDSIVFYTPKGGAEGVDTEGAKALLRGEAAMASLPLNLLEEFKERENIRVIRWQDLSLSFIGMNVKKPPLDDRRVRQAIALAMYRQDMLNLWPAGKELALGIMPPGLPGYSPEPRTYSYDLAAARRLLASAGYGPGHPLPTLTLWKSTANQSVRQVDTLMVNSLAEAGIHVNLKYVSWGELDRVITGRRAQLFGLAWVADIPDPDTFLRALFYSTSGTNYFRYSDRTVDSLLDVARRTANSQVRMNAYRTVEARVVKAAPLVPLFHSSTFVGLREDVSGLEVNPLGISTLAMEKLRIAKRVQEREPRQTRL
ncbi:MAG TPA: ABC transporter substrate-binding protein [Candidatus Eisenbacteria bacterium]|nr:ABC transporter substrate-binding protein [Candidatus Eisenbacteria bacterium]